MLTHAKLASGVTAAQSDMESASATDMFVTPGRLHFHPAVSKVWGVFNGTGTVALGANRNISSITDNGTGNYTANFTTSMSSTDYAVTGSATITTTVPGAGVIAVVNPCVRATGSVQLICADTSSDALSDCAFVSLDVKGDQ
jgi:hypothetical protein